MTFIRAEAGIVQVFLPSIVMPGLVPGIYDFSRQRAKTSMAGTSPAMTDKC
jgi:hypothetical protein